MEERRKKGGRKEWRNTTGEGGRGTNLGMKMHLFILCWFKYAKIPHCMVQVTVEITLTYIYFVFAVRDTSVVFSLSLKRGNMGWGRVGGG